MFQSKVLCLKLGGDRLNNDPNEDLNEIRIANWSGGR